MKTLSLVLGLVFGLFAVFSGAPAATMPGGLEQTAVTKPEVREAAAFAIQQQTRILQAQPNGAAAKLELVKIIAAQEQVVAGINYHLTLRVKLNGQLRQAEAVVWWQAWRKPDPYQLTTWKWSSE